MRIALWGPKSSGKTTYLAMVYGTALKSRTRWIVRPNDISSTDFVRENVNRMRRGEFPLATIPSPGQEPIYYSYEFRPGEDTSSKDEEKDLLESLFDFLKGSDLKRLDSPKQDRVIVEFADVAGEMYLSESLENPLWEHLATSDGLICLLDPLDAEDHFEITFQLLQYLWLKLKDRPNALIDGKLPHYVAFCFSKIDDPSLIQYLNKPKELVKFLELRMNMNIDKLLIQYVIPDRLKYFTISSVGQAAEAEGMAIQNPREISPINILEPLRWLFQTTGR